MIKNRVLNNAKWIIACKIVQSLLQLVMGMLCARYLGPSNYGVINYAASVVGFAMPVMQLGLQATLVQELIDHPEQESKVMGTSLVMNLVSGTACFITVNAVVGVMNHNEPITMIVCALYSISLIVGALDIFQCWFQHKLLSKYPSVVMIFAYIIVSAYRIFLLVTSKSVYWFSVVNALDYAIIGVSMIAIYKKISNQKLCFSFELAKELFKRSKYYILASMMVTVFQNTDHIMLKNISGNTQNGYYTAAITASIVLQFVYMAIIDSMRPAILEYKKTDEKKYEEYISRLYCITTYLSLAQCVFFTIFAKHIIWVLYGEDYIQAAKVLQIVVWYLSFSYMGSVRNIWILAEGKHKLLWKINLAGALANVAVNALLIPSFGAAGAAIASLATQIFTNFILGFIVKPLRENNRLLVKGLNPKLFFNIFKTEDSESDPPKIDFVITWVDDADPIWREKKVAHTKAESLEWNTSVRYRNWDNLKYWFRGVEKFAPWVNNVYFVTDNQKPEWLNMDHPKLKWVKHTDFIPSEYLPCFNSNAIEWNLHRIEGLSEQFVYFNDDLFLLDKTSPQDFFKDGLPCDLPRIGKLKQSGFFEVMLLNNLELLKKYFVLKKSIKKNGIKWIKGQSALQIFKHFIYACKSGLPHSVNWHINANFSKKTFEILWDKEFEKIDATCKNKLRSRDDVTLYCLRDWQLYTGEFYPQKPLGKIFTTASLDYSNELIDYVTKQQGKIVCLNDTEDEKNFEEHKKIINDALHSILPEKSSFEL